MTRKNFKIIHIFKIIRPHQWVKNVLVFTPLFMSHNFDFNNLILSTKAFIIFSLIASSIYVINDIVDLKLDNDLHKLQPEIKHLGLNSDVIKQLKIGIDSDRRVKELKGEFKGLAGRALKAKEVNSTDSIEIISASPYSPKRTAYYRRFTTFKVE